MANEIATAAPPPAGGNPLARLREDDTPRALLEFHSPCAGLIAMPISRVARSMSTLMVGLVCMFLLIATFAPIDRVVTGPGILKPLDSTIVVQPYDQAIVHSIDVRPGDIVKPGQVIARLDPTMSQANVTDLHKQVDSFSAEVDRLTAEAAGKDYHPDLSNPASTDQEAAFLSRQAEYKARVDDLTQQIASTEADLAGYQAAATAFGQRLKIASDVQRMRLQLERDQVGSHLNSLAAMDSTAEMQNNEASSIESANSARGKIASLKAQRDAYERDYEAQTYADLTQAQRKLYQARDDLAGADLRHKLVVFRASKPAIVVTIAPVSVGSVLSPGAEFITLMPIDSRYEASVMVAAAQAGYVKLGDSVNVKFDTLPYIFYGSAHGTVENISADSFTPGTQSGAQSGGSTLTGMAEPGKTYYSVRIAIDKYDFHNPPKSFRLTPGMPVTADIKVGRRTIMDYLLSSVVPSLSQGMRDP